MIYHFLRKNIIRRFTGVDQTVFEARAPSVEELVGKFQDIHELGIYLHIPFCEQICPYCPYNKERYDPELAENYTLALKKEIDFYTDIIGNRPVSSFYIGGGTPTTMLHTGMKDIIEHIYKSFNMQCSIHMESHPNHLDRGNLDFIKSLGVKYLSIGVESLQDRHLKTLSRPYTAEEVMMTVKLVSSQGFDCVNADFIFDLPGQTYAEIEEAGQNLVDLGISQVAAYPLFRFPYTRLGEEAGSNRWAIPTLFKRRKMLRILEDIFYRSGFERTSVWAFTEKGISKYCSVTVPLYLGLGASGGTYLKDVFYINTFNVAEYINAMEKSGRAISLSINLTEKMQMGGWLYWRIYETRFRKSDFMERFEKDIDRIYGRYLKILAFLGYLKEKGEEVVLTDKGTYWLHAFEDFFSIDFISKLWGESSLDPWPEKVVL
jgi:coproporphyrinogen III oxidase-like Fe-S oxidoreductase